MLVSLTMTYPVESCSTCVGFSVSPDDHNYIKVRVFPVKWTTYIFVPIVRIGLLLETLIMWKWSGMSPLCKSYSWQTHSSMLFSSLKLSDWSRLWLANKIWTGLLLLALDGSFSNDVCMWLYRDTLHQSLHFVAALINGVTAYLPGCEGQQVEGWWDSTTIIIFITKRMYNIVGRVCANYVSGL